MRVRELAEHLGATYEGNGEKEITGVAMLESAATGDLSFGEEIFQPFIAFRRGGTGIGLAIVYSVISEHGGDIGVESTPGAGATFTVSLPMERA